MWRLFVVLERLVVTVFFDVLIKHEQDLTWRSFNLPMYKNLHLIFFSEFYFSRTYLFSLSLSFVHSLSLTLALCFALLFYTNRQHSLESTKLYFFFSSTQCTYRWDCHLCSPADWNSWPVNTTINIKLFFYLKKKILFLFLLPLHDHDEIEFFFLCFILFSFDFSLSWYLYSFQSFGSNKRNILRQQKEIQVEKKEK